MGGVGFKVFISLANQGVLPSIGSMVEVLTYLHVREDGLTLYGFLNEGEIDFFESLISVSGIGPKSALGIMSVAPIEKLSAAISEGQIELLQRSSGVGRKTAERIIVELKDKIKLEGSGRTVEMMESDKDMYDALLSLGYSAKQAKDAVSKVNPEIIDSSERLREAFKIIKS